MKVDVQYYAKSQVKSKKKVFTSTDVQFSTQNRVKTKKKVFTSADVQFSTQNQVKTKKRPSRPQTPIFRAKLGEESKLGQEKENNVTDVQFFVLHQVQNIHLNEMLK